MTDFQSQPDSKPGISVVITCYNLERFIASAIGSVLTQADAEPIEVIVVDDCSTDASEAAIRVFPSIRYIQTPANQGVLLATLAGIEAARYDIISLLDGDDIWAPGKVAAIREAFVADPMVALVTHDLHFVDTAGERLDRPTRPSEVLGGSAPSARGDKVRRGILELSDYVWLGSAMSFRKGLGGFDAFASFARSTRDPKNCYQDWPLAYWLAVQLENSMAYIDEPLVDYRLHGSNYSGDARTIERALRNFTRTRNTHDMIAAIADFASVGPTLQKIANTRLGWSQAQVDLYSGNRYKALAGLARSYQSVARSGHVVKELIRFGFGAIAGPKALVKLANRR